jgi:hypothetical protein
MVSGRCSPPRTPQICVLDADPDVGRRLSPREFAAARPQSLARVRTLPAGPWDPEHELHDEDGAGLLVLDGMLRFRITVSERRSCELLGAGDLLRPWEEGAGDGALTERVEWMLLSPAPVAVLDADVTRRLAAWPTILGELAGRALRRSRALAARMAIAQLPAIELRVQLLFWHLADRWGHVTPDGVVLRIAPGQETIAQLIGASRGRVNGALRVLRDDGLLERLPEGWLLCGAPPHELLRDRSPVAAATR